MELPMINRICIYKYTIYMSLKKDEWESDRFSQLNIATKIMEKINRFDNFGNSNVTKYSIDDIFIYLNIEWSP